jgi:O-antigen ligase
VGLAGLIFVVPLMMGGRHPLGHLTLAALAVVTALAWIVRQSLRSEGAWRRTAADWLLVAVLALLVLQLVSLPQAVAPWLAPHTSEILPLWSSEGGEAHPLGVWSTVSLTPAATQGALVLFLAYSLVFLVTVQRIRQVDDVERLLRWCALAAVLMATFGIVQYLTNNGKFFWFYQHPDTTPGNVPKGSFTNRNHFSHFLALGIGPLIWWTQNALKRRHNTDEFGQPVGIARLFESKTTWRALALGIVLFAVLLSLSRGGAIATLLATAISATICYRASAAGMRLVATLSAAAVLIGALLTVFGYDRVSGRLDDLVSGSIESLDQGEGRRTIWRAVIKAIPDYAVLGSGVGSHREVYPMYLEWNGSRKHYSHAESGYLQVALETGLGGLALLLTGIGICGFWCISTLRSASSTRVMVCAGAVSASLAASVAHSVVDFVWYIPGLVTVTAILAACACRLWQISCKPKAGRRSRQVLLPRPIAVGVAVCLVLIGTWMVSSRIGPVMAEQHWGHFLALRRASADTLLCATRAEDAAERQSSEEELLAAESLIIAELAEAVRWNPGHARAHLYLAESYLRLFECLQHQPTTLNPMPVNHIRDAVFASQADHVPPDERLSSREKLDAWLARAVGDHRKILDLALHHARRALALCPLHGEAYLQVGELCFLEGARLDAKATYIDQALRVRPFDGMVLFQAGKEASMVGDFEKCVEYWRRSWSCGSVYQEDIVDLACGHASAEVLHREIRDFLDIFRPDLDGLRLLCRRYEQVAPPEQLVELWSIRARAVEQEACRTAGPETADLWLEAMKLYGKLNAQERRLECGRHAMRCDPNHYRVREQLGRCLADLEQFAEAEAHLRWCWKRNSESPSLEKLVNYVARKRVDQEGQAAATYVEADYRR